MVVGVGVVGIGLGPALDPTPNAKPTPYQEGGHLKAPPGGKGEGGGGTDARGPPLILTTSGHPDPRRRRSPAAKLEGRHASSKKIERPKCGSGFFSRRDPNPNPNPVPNPKREVLA